MRLPNMCAVKCPMGNQGGLSGAPSPCRTCVLWYAHWGSRAGAPACCLLAVTLPHLPAGLLLCDGPSTCCSPTACVCGSTADANQWDSLTSLPRFTSLSAEAEAAEQLAEMTRQGRYVRDIWS